MEANTANFAPRPGLILKSPGRSTIPRRLRVTRWQAHSWTKTIIELRMPAATREQTGALGERGRQSSPRCALRA